MRIRLTGLAATAILVLAAVLGGTAIAGPPHHSHGKPNQLPPIDMSNAANCDFIAEPGNSLCMLPFPDDYYTTSDPSSPTGRRIDFKTAGMPANVLGSHIAADPYNAADGFSQGATILLKVPGIETTADVAATGATPINHIGRYREPDAPVVVIDAETGRRQPIWSRSTRPLRTRARRRWRFTRPSTSPRGTATSSPCAGCATPPGPGSKRPPPSATTATGCRPSSRRSMPAASTSRKSSSGAERQSSARRATSSGTSPPRATRA